MSERIKLGHLVSHQVFGPGQVMYLHEDLNRIIIKFRDHGEKKFITSMVLPSIRKIGRGFAKEEKTMAARA